MSACSTPPATKSYKTIGSITRMDPELDSLIQPNATIEIIAEGYDWTEGPLWLENEKALLFSDIPPNKIFKWTEKKGAELYLTPSGYTGSVPRGGEPGSNALILNKDGQLVLCQHGDRRMALMDADLNAPAAKFITLTDNYKGKKLNSPNDAIFRSNGDLLFTDPPYGLEGNDKDPAKELPFQGVFKLSNGELTLLTDSLTRPNGLAFMKNETRLIVANSDSEKAMWYLFDVSPGGLLVNQRVFFDATPDVAGKKGLPDGLKVDKKDNLFATGPGGVYIFNAAGKQIGKIEVPEACSNIAFGDDERTLFVTADMWVLRVRLR